MAESTVQEKKKESYEGKKRVMEEKYFPHNL
jgi:hypothetical protein